MNLSGKKELTSTQLKVVMDILKSEAKKGNNLFDIYYEMFNKSDCEKSAKEVTYLKDLLSDSSLVAFVSSASVEIVMYENATEREKMTKRN